LYFNQLVMNFGLGCAYSYTPESRCAADLLADFTRL